MLKRIALLVLGFSLFTAAIIPSSAQTQGKTITPNFKDTDIVQVIEAVSEVTGKTFIIDARVRGVPVNVIGQTPMSADAFYETFLSVLALNSFVAVPAGKSIKIMPADSGRYSAGNDLPERISSTSDELVTQVFNVTNVSAAALATNLRPLLSTQAHFSAYPPTNTIIISDRASNVNRLMRIIRRIDQAGDGEMDFMRLEYATAADVVRNINQLFQAQGAEGTQVRVIADDRTNGVVISGEKSQRLRAKTIIAMLDSPTESGGGTEVVYLQFADAEKMAAILNDQAVASAQVAGGPPTAPAAGGGGASQLGKDVTILAEPETNSLIITAPPKVMSALISVVKKLDIARAQVQVEAIIVEVTQDKTAELGINWAAFSEDDDTRIPVGGFLSPVGGVSIVDLANAVDDPSTAPPGLVNGTTIGIGRIAAGGVNFGAMLRAIRGDGNSNVLATPSLTVMDNKEAEIKNTQEVPFITGAYTNNNSGGGGEVNPFQTVQREEVGTILKVTPQIAAEGNSLLLKLNVESSSVAQTSVSAVDITTLKRTITTDVLIEDGGIIVIGGLISSESTSGEQRVPYLGRIPIIGLAFKTRNAQARKTNLMIFIRPKILRTANDTATQTNSKYNFMREEQRKANHRELLPMLPGVEKPLLPEPPPPPPKTEPAPTSVEEKEKASKENTGEETPPPTPPLRQQ